MRSRYLLRGESMPVFVSYQRVDVQKATEISIGLTALGITTYLDLMDPVLRTTSDITKQILFQLGRCTHLMAVISNSTRASWWVPFEIGAATHNETRITSYRRDDTQLPQFLANWPYITRDAELVEFARQYFSDNAHGEKNFSRFSAESTAKSVRSADQFHRTLKNRLGQI